uniref:Si:ch211-129p13.1 n=1 Tax=Amphilophus citrinellus TaxID=61819 RepID=A0A3Q0T4B2_AMPCI
MKGHLTSDDIQNSGHKDCDVQYAELDTAALASSPSPRSSAHTGPGDLVTPGGIQKSL